jgi:hypothetical protein
MLVDESQYAIASAAQQSTDRFRGVVMVYAEPPAAIAFCGTLAYSADSALKVK